VIEQLSNFPANVVAIVCKGRVTKADYDAVLVPAVRDALENMTRSGSKSRLTFRDLIRARCGRTWVGMEHLTRAGNVSRLSRTLSGSSTRCVFQLHDARASKRFRPRKPIRRATGLSLSDAPLCPRASATTRLAARRPLRRSQA
jgi:hypothetical protein